MKSKVSIKWMFGEREIVLCIEVPNKHKNLAKQIVNNLYKCYRTALKAYAYKVVLQTKEE